MKREKFLKNIEEMAELKRNNTAEENSQPRTKVQAQSSKEKSPGRGIEFHDRGSATCKKL